MTHTGEDRFFWLEFSFFGFNQNTMDAASASATTTAPDTVEARPAFMVSRSFMKSPVLPFLQINHGSGPVSGAVVINSQLDPIELGGCAVRDARMQNVYAYCCVFRFSDLLKAPSTSTNLNVSTTAGNNHNNRTATFDDKVAALQRKDNNNSNSGGAAAATMADAKRRLLNSLRALARLSSGRMCVAWHSPDETLDEALLTLVNESCIGEQVPLMCAASAKEAGAIVQSLSRPTGVRNARQSTFGRAASSVNAKMAALLLHAMGTQMLSESEAVRAVDAFARLRPGATPGDMIAFLGTRASAKEAAAFLQQSTYVPKAKAERVVSVFCAQFDRSNTNNHFDQNNGGADGVGAAAGLSGGGFGNRAREDDMLIQRGGGVNIADSGAFDDLLSKIASNMEAREEQRRAQKNNNNNTADIAAEENPFLAPAASTTAPTRNPVTMMQHLQQQQQLTLAKAATLQADHERRQQEESRKNMSSAMADALRRQFEQNDNDDEDEFA